MGNDNNAIIPLEQQFAELLAIINSHRSAASQAVNEQQILTAWNVGGYVSHKLKTQQWGSKVVSQFVQYIKTNAPDVKGYSRSSIYNMVMFYDEYSSPCFMAVVQKYIPSLIVQMPTAQLTESEIVQPVVGQLEKLLAMTTYTNHVIILSNCDSSEERLFYILHSAKERLKKRELQRTIDTDTYTSLLSQKGNLSKGLLETYPQASVMFKDTTYIDFLGLPKKYSESKLRKGLVEHMKQFILELGKDLLFVDQEYTLNVGGSDFKVDLLFFHRGLRALVAVELKRRAFKPGDMGQLEFYLEALDRDVKREDENPSVGIILCPEANRTVVEYAMNRCMSPAMVAEYKRLLIPKEKMQLLLQEYCEFFIDNN